jgi:hypothetical protein
MEYTGPGIFTDTIFEYLNDPRYYTARDRSENAPMLLGESVTWKDLTGLRAPKLLGDVVFLPITSFSPDKKSMGGEGQDSPLAFVKHDFQGESSVAGAGCRGHHTDGLATFHLQAAGRARKRSREAASIGVVCGELCRC